MADKKRSAQPDGATARHLERLARREAETAAQIAAVALEFFKQLPEDPELIMRELNAPERAADFDRLTRKVTRQLIETQREARRREREAQEREDIEQIKTGDDLLDARLRKMARERSAARGRKPPPL